jgi:hypothetical protein
MKTKIISLFIVLAYFSASFIIFSGQNVDLNFNPNSFFTKWLGFPYFLSVGVGFYSGITGIILSLLILGAIIWFLLYHLLTFLKRKL